MSSSTRRQSRTRATGRPSASQAQRRPRGQPTAFRPEPGRVYRTADLAAYTANPARLAKHLVATGRLIRLAGGLYGVPRESKFGRLVPRSDEVLRAFLKGSPFLLTGPEHWNATGLGSTSVFPLQVVYNTKRSGRITLGGRVFWFRRKPFPEQPTPEWYAIDLIENRKAAGVDLATLQRGIANACRRGSLSPLRLEQAAREWGTEETHAAVHSVVNTFLPPQRPVQTRR